MTDVKFTAGPWRVEDGTTLIWGACTEDPSTYGMGYPIAECRITPTNPTWAKGPDDDEGIANAHLIAASPDLYEALKELMDEAGALCREPVTDGEIAARAALKKAESKS